MRSTNYRCFAPRLGKKRVKNCCHKTTRLSSWDIEASWTGARVRTLDGHRALLEAAGADVSSLRLKRLRSIVDVVEVTF